MQVVPLTTHSQAPTAMASTLEATFRTLKASATGGRGGGGGGGFGASPATTPGRSRSGRSQQQGGSNGDSVFFLGSCTGDSTLLGYGLLEGPQVAAAAAAAAGGKRAAEAMAAGGGGGGDGGPAKRLKTTEGAGMKLEGDGEVCGWVGGGGGSRAPIPFAHLQENGKLQH